MVTHPRFLPGVLFYPTNHQKHITIGEYNHQISTPHQFNLTTFESIWRKKRTNLRHKSCLFLLHKLYPIGYNLPPKQNNYTR